MARKDACPASPNPTKPSQISPTGSSGTSPATLEMIFEQNQAILKKNNEIMKSLEFCLRSVADLTSKLDTVRVDISALSGRVESTEAENLELSRQLKSALGRINRSEQASLINGNALEIRGLPHKNQEEPEQLVIDISKSLPLD